MKNIILILFTFLSLFSSNSIKASTVSDSIIPTSTPQYQYPESARKGRFYFYWGYNRATFLDSDIRFAGPNYDFTLFDVKAVDYPTTFNVETYFGVTTLWIPQYNYRIGYYLSPRWGISLGLDHIKYVVLNEQTVRMTGNVSATASQKYAGAYNNSPVVTTEDFLRFEHTDGLNLLSLDAEYGQPLAKFWKSRLRLSFQGGGGAGPVIPRTDSSVFGDGLNNKFHVAGWGISGKAGFKLDIFKKFFIESQVRAGYINLSDIILHNEQPQRAKQSIYFNEIFVVAGIYFGG